MTVTAQGFSGPTYLQIPGNGTATVFSFPFLITTATDLAVGFITSSGYTGQLSGFTVTIGIGVGQVTFAVAPPSGTTVDIRSVIPETQPTNFANLGSYFPENTTNALDRVTRNIADLYRLTYQFGLHGPDAENTPWTMLPTAAGRANNALIFDGNGQPTIGVLPASTFVQATWDFFLGASTQLAGPVGRALYPQSAAEISLGITPVNFGMAYGTLDRYGTNFVPGTTDMSLATQHWMSVGLVTGGELRYGPGPYLLTSPINCTFSGAGGCPGVTVRSLGTGHNTNANAQGFLLNHNGIGFDCTGNDTIQFVDPCIKTLVPSVNIPICAILFARNATGASLLNRVVRPKIVGYFRVAAVYNYGSEQFVIENGYVANYNPAANTACFIASGNNVAGLTSTFVTIATGGQSTTVIDAINMSYLNVGGTSTSDCVRLEAVQGYHQFGGWQDAPGGRALIYIDQTVFVGVTPNPTNLCSVYGLKSEHTGSPVRYGILWGASTVPSSINTGWTISGCRLETTVNAIAAVDANTTLDGFTLDPVSEQASLGLNIPGTIQGFSQLRTGAMVLNVGHIINSLVLGLPANWTFGTNVNCQLINISAGQTAGFGTPTNAAIISNFNGSTAYTNTQLAGMVAAILNVLKTNLDITV